MYCHCAVASVLWSVSRLCKCKSKHEGELIEAIQPKVSDRMNASLIRDFQATEVEKALKQMHPSTAPGPDGMPPLFYQHFWPTVRETVICNTLNFLDRKSVV